MAQFSSPWRTDLEPDYALPPALCLAPLCFISAGLWWAILAAAWRLFS